MSKLSFKLSDFFIQLIDSYFVSKGVRMGG